MADPAERQVLSFKTSGANLAAAAETVREVLRMPLVTRVPHAPASLFGLANLRGVVTPIISLSRLLGREQDAASSNSRLLVLDLESPVGLAVDEVTGLGRRSGELRPGELFMDGDASVKVVDLVALLRTEFANLARPRAEHAMAPAASAPVRSTEATLGLVTFELAGQLYALRLDQVREVLRLPTGAAALPDSADADMGVIPFRERVLSLVSLRRLLGLPHGASEGGRVLIMEVGGAVAGLVVDRLDAIIRAPESLVSAVPAVLNRGGGEARIEALVRSEDGRNLVSLLAADRLFDEEATARLLESGRLDEDAMTRTPQAALESFLIFQLGDEEYGLPIAAVSEVVRAPDRLTRAPKTPAFVEGVMNLRGKVIPVIDQARRFDAEGARDLAARRIIVTSADDLEAGFMVDRVSEILNLAADQIGPAPQLPGQAAGVFRRVARVGERLILLVDPQGLLEQAEADLLKAMAATPAS